MQVEEIACSPVCVGNGTVRCAHGILPVPAPATAEIIKGMPVYTSTFDGELLTPTGAAILTAVLLKSGATYFVVTGCGTVEAAVK